MKTRRRRRSFRPFRSSRSFDKRALMQEINADQKRAAKDKLSRLRSSYKKARKVWPKDRARAKAYCGQQRTNAKAHIAKLRAAMRLRVKLRAMAIQRAARARCSLKRTVHRTKVERARQAYREESRFQASLRRSARVTVKRRSTFAERASESDDQVRQNIPADLIPLFERVRRQIRGNPRKTRTEAFLEYVESHPREQFDAVEDEVDRMIAARERQLRGG